VKCSNVVITCVAKYVSVAVTVGNSEAPRSPAEAISTAPAQCVNPLTKEQLQQAFIYLLKVLWLCILMIVLFHSYLIVCHLTLQQSQVILLCEPGLTWSKSGYVCQINNNQIVSVRVCVCACHVVCVCVSHLLGSRV